jgi:hypothetical protein
MPSQLLGPNNYNSRLGLRTLGFTGDSRCSGGSSRAGFAMAAAARIGARAGQESQVFLILNFQKWCGRADPAG